MSSFIVEFVCWTASPAYIADPSLAQPAINIIKNADGNLGLYSGLVEEDKSTLYMVILWETYEHHRKFMNDKFAYDKLFRSLAPIAANYDNPDIKMHHVDFGSLDIVPTITSGVTEYMVVTLKEGKTREDMEAVAVEFNYMFQHEEVATHPALIGWIKEDPKSCVLAVGWTDIKAHRAAVATGNYRPLLGYLQTIVDIKTSVHIKLTPSQ